MLDSVGLHWVLTALFAVLLVPCVRRLVRLDYPGNGGHVLRRGDLTELLLTVAMIAMVSPVGGPIPAAGWQAVLGLSVLALGVVWWRARGRTDLPHRHDAHYFLSAAAMLYMFSAMQHVDVAHGPWLNMSTMEHRTATLWPIAAAFALYFLIDALRSVTLILRGGTTLVVSDHASRLTCRGVMGLGMAYMFLAGLWPA